MERGYGHRCQAKATGARMPVGWSVAHHPARSLPVHHCAPSASQSLSLSLSVSSGRLPPRSTTLQPRRWLSTGSLFAVAAPSLASTCLALHSQCATASPHYFHCHRGASASDRDRPFPSLLAAAAACILCAGAGVNRAQVVALTRHVAASVAGNHLVTLAGVFLRAG